MLQNRYVWVAALIVVLFVADIVNWLCSGWGLITVRVHDKPLGQVIKSIERQGWVTIYTNIDLSTPVSLDVIRVPLAEAMESLAVNTPADYGNNNDSGNGGPPPGGGNGGNGGPPGGGGGGGGGGFRRGGGVQWKLAFFTGSSSMQVKQEISTFQQGGDLGDDLHIYSYQTPLQMLNSDEGGMPAADPRLQTWSGYTYQPPPPPPAPAAGDDNSNNQAEVADQTQPDPPSTAQDYFQVLAQSADIFIMSPTGWQPKVPGAPAAGGLIASAVKRLVGSAHGSVTQAFVLYARPPRPRNDTGGQPRGGFAGGDTGWATMEDRMRNAINGLPADARGPALAQLNQEVAFQKQVRALPPDQRRAMMRKHMMGRFGGNDFRMSPDRRAQRYARAVANRQAVRGQ